VSENSKATTAAEKRQREKSPIELDSDSDDSEPVPKKTKSCKSPSPLHMQHISLLLNSIPAKSMQPSEAAPSSRPAAVASRRVVDDFEEIPKTAKASVVGLETSAGFFREEIARREAIIESNKAILRSAKSEFLRVKALLEEARARAKAKAKAN
jgi:hypothetical protein